VFEYARPITTEDFMQILAELIKPWVCFAVWRRWRRWRGGEMHTVSFI